MVHHTIAADARYPAGWTAFVADLTVAARDRARSYRHDAALRH